MVNFYIFQTYLSKLFSNVLLHIKRLWTRMYYKNVYITKCTVYINAHVTGLKPQWRNVYKHVLIKFLLIPTLVGCDCVV